MTSINKCRVNNVINLETKEHMANNNKRKLSDRDNLMEQNINKKVKMNVDHYKSNNLVLVLTFDTDIDDLYHVPFVYTFTEELFKCYSPIIDHLQTRKEAYKLVSNDVYKQIERLEDVIELYTTNKDDDDGPITYINVWTNAIKYWESKKLVKLLCSNVEINDHANVNIVKCVKVLDI